MKHFITYPGKVLYERNQIEPGMLVYGLVKKDWFKMKVLRISTNTALCRDVCTGQGRRPNLNCHTRVVRRDLVDTDNVKLLWVLWMRYGNNSPKRNDNAHHLIQHILEQKETDLQQEYRTYAKQMAEESLNRLGEVLNVVWIRGVLLQSTDEVSI